MNFGDLKDLDRRYLYHRWNHISNTQRSHSLASVDHDSYRWTPTIIQFSINQYAVRKIIITAKWQNLNCLPVQIKEFQNNDLSAVPDTMIMQIVQLMGLHDHISAKRNSIPNWVTRLSF